MNSPQTTSYRDLKHLKAVHSQFSHQRFLRNYPVLSDNVICHPSTPFTCFCECSCFVLHKIIVYVLKNWLPMPSHFTHKFKYVCYFQSHKITWTSYSIHKILSHLWRPSSISISHFQSVFLLDSETVASFCFPSLFNFSRQISEFFPTSYNHTFLFKADALSAAICNSQSLIELKTAENNVLQI